jgi:Fe-S cluster assembly iron-binding protein IscA
MDGVSGLVLDNVTIINTTNHGQPGIYDKYYTGSKDGGHPLQTGNSPNLGYMGADTYGVGLFCVKGLSIKNLKVDKTVSHSGKSFGICIQGDSDGVVNDTEINYVMACLRSKFEDGPINNPNTPLACGVYAGPDTVINFNKVTVDKVVSPNPWIKAIKFDIDSNSSSLMTSKLSPLSTSTMCPSSTCPSQSSIGFFVIFLIIIVLIVFFWIAYRSKRYT